MEKITTEMIKNLRALTGAGVMDCRNALMEANCDISAAEKLIRANRSVQEVKEETPQSSGIVHSYIHTGSHIGVLVEVGCDTDFAARTDEFKEFVHNVAIHIAAMNPLLISPESAPWDGEGDVSELQYLLDQPFVKDPTKTVGDLLAEISDRISEPISIKRFVRWTVGEDMGVVKPEQPERPKGFLAAAAVLILMVLAGVFFVAMCG